MQDKVYPKKPDEIPNQEHFAIVHFESVSEWSGYKEDSGSSSIHAHYVVYTSQAAWEAEIRRLTLQTGYTRTEFKAIRSKPVSISVQVNVGIQ